MVEAKQRMLEATGEAARQAAGDVSGRRISDAANTAYSESKAIGS
jgi:hypothetical protein